MPAYGTCHLIIDSLLSPRTSEISLPKKRFDPQIEVVLSLGVGRVQRQEIRHGLTPR